MNTFMIMNAYGQSKKEKNKIEKQTKIVQIYAENDYGMFGGKISFKIYSDSTYICEKNEKSPEYEKKEVFNGAYKIVNDTINFFPSNFRPINATKALIKNNFIEFVDGEFPLKIEIKKNIFKSKQNLDLNKFKSYAVFTFNEKFNRHLFYGSKPKSINAYDLDQNELEEIHQILSKCILENKTKLKNESDYVKQCIAIKNSKNEIEVWIACFCKESSIIGNSYKYSLIDMSDGGNCNISLKINLTKHIVTKLNISGSV